MARQISGVVGFWPDEHLLLDAAKKTYQAGFRQFDSITPFPVHGMDDATGIKPSPIPWVTFFAGLIGASAGAALTYWTSAVSYRLVVGGKPLDFFNALPGYIPIIFECTILFAALSSVAAMFILNRLPKVDPPIIDPDLTCSKFALFIPDTEANYSAEKAEQHLRSIGATEVRKVAEF